MSTSFQITGNFSQDMTTLLGQVARTASGAGTNGNAQQDFALQAFAKAVSGEADAQGTPQGDASSVAASNIAGSLGNGTYDQQSSIIALDNAQRGRSTDSVATARQVIEQELASGDYADASNNAIALNNEAGNGSASSPQNTIADAANGFGVNKTTVIPGSSAYQTTTPISTTPSNATPAAPNTGTTTLPSGSPVSLTNSSGMTNDASADVQASMADMQKVDPAAVVKLNNELNKGDILGIDSALKSAHDDGLSTSDTQTLMTAISAQGINLNINNGSIASMLLNPLN